MKFGVREICDVVFRATAYQTLGKRQFYKDEPVLYFDTLKTSSLDSAATTVYATGGRGNSQLVAWEGDKTLTFVMEDALISPEGFAILSGAGLVDATETPVYQHITGTFEVKDGAIIIPVEGHAGDKLIFKDMAALSESEKEAAEVFVMNLDDYNNIEGEPMVPTSVTVDPSTGATIKVDTCKLSTYVFVDYYVKRAAGAKQINIAPDSFGGYYYVEASTLFRREADGKDMPAEFIIPKAKVQSNFSFAMASSGDPSTFTFTLDAFPGYLKFDRSKQVLAVIQIIEDESGKTEQKRTKNVCEEPGK